MVFQLIKEKNVNIRISSKWNPINNDLKLPYDER